MLMSFGDKHKGKHVGLVLVEDYQYFIWMKSKGMSNYKEYRKMLEYIKVIDEKPFIRPCMGVCNQKNTTTRFSMYHRSNSTLHYFCDYCSPNCLGADADKLLVGHKFDDILSFSRGNKTELRKNIKDYVCSKGFPSRKSEEALNDFFDDSLDYYDNSAINKRHPTNTNKLERYSKRKDIFD